MFESIKDAKQAAKVLREYLNTYSVKVPSQSETLHLLAQMHGCKNWQTFKAKIESQKLPEELMPTPKYPIRDTVPRGSYGSLVTVAGRIQIQGTLERVSGLAYVMGASRKPDGELDLEYEGETKIWWDEQRTVREKGQMIFVDHEGNEYLESEVMLVEEGSEASPAVQG